MKKLLFVINPRSGKEQIRTKLLDILDIFVKADFFVSVYVTQKAKDAVREVKRHGSGKQMIVCSGGDGTLNEIITGMMSLPARQRPVLGYIPAGSTNDYAVSLGISRNMKRAAQCAVEGVDFAADVGKFGADRYFVYVAAFGAFTEVAYSTPQEAKNFLGHQAYMLEAIKRFISLKSYQLRFEWDGNVMEEEFLLGLITNTISVGGFKGLVGHDVALDDGEFEVLLVRKPRSPADLGSIVSYLLLREDENDCIFKFRAKTLTVTSKEPVDWTLDGEFGGSHQQVTVVNLKQEIVIRREPGDVPARDYSGIWKKLSPEQEETLFPADYGETGH